MSVEELRGEQRQIRLAILVNTIAPYRVPIYAALAEQFDTLVLHGGGEPNRNWQVSLPQGLRTQRVWTLQMRAHKRTGAGEVKDAQYVHLNLGLLGRLPLFRPHAIFTNELGVRTLIALLHGRLTGAVVWVGWEGTVHSERYVGGIKRKVRLQIAKRVRHWVTFGAQSREYLLEIGADPAAMLEVQNCVPQERFQQSPSETEQLFAHARGPLLLSVGQLISRKGMDKLIAACGRLASRGRHFTLVVVGEGPERERLFKAAAMAKLANFHLLANQTQEQLNRLYRRADVFVLPTVEDVWGLVVNEALWAGTTVLCSQYAGCAEVLPESNIFDPLSESSFDAALERALTGRLAPADVTKLLTWQQVSERLCQAIAESVPERTRQGRADVQASVSTANS